MVVRVHFLEPNSITDVYFECSQCADIGLNWIALHKVHQITLFNKQLNIIHGEWRLYIISYIFICDVKINR